MALRATRATALHYVFSIFNLDELPEKRKKCYIIYIIIYIYYNIYNIKLVAPCFPKTIFPNVARSACSVKRDMAAWLRWCYGAMVRSHHHIPWEKACCEIFDARHEYKTR